MAVPMRKIAMNPAKGTVLYFGYIDFITRKSNNEKIKLSTKNRIYALKLKRGISAIKNKTSPHPIRLSKGFIKPLFLIEKYIVTTIKFTIKNKNDLPHSI
jgi:hypothetical protein